MSRGTQIAITEEIGEGSEPIHRRVVRDGETLLTIFGNAQENRWILGWPVSPWLDTAPIVELACWYLFDRLEAPLAAWVLRDDDFVQVGEPLPNASEEQVQVLNARLGAVEQPDMIVLGTDLLQLELIFHEGRLSTLTMLGKDWEIHRGFLLIYQTHLSDVLRGSDLKVLLRALYLLLSTESIEEVKHGDDEGEWGLAVSSGHAKFG
jgi:hypothetical protein